MNINDDIMFALERRMEILELINVQKRVSVTDLAERFFTSEATIRRDLMKLEKQNLIKRTYGGALLIDPQNRDVPIDIRSREHYSEKQLIGKKAAEFIDNSDTIFMDASSTTLTMVEHMKQLENLKIITNGVQTTAKIAETLHQDVYCAGGKMMENNMALAGFSTIAFVGAYFVQKLFLSCWGITSERGLMDLYEEESALKQKMIECANTVYLLCDSSKFEREAFCFVSSFEHIDYLITDKLPEGELMNALKRAGVEIILA